MYRWLLCWRYLRTRYIALASVVSVTLGVATLIIVNSVMDGFTQQMQERMHGILSDVIIESHSATGVGNPQAFKDRIRQVVGDDLEGITTVVHVPAMMAIQHRGEPVIRQINLIGIDVDTYADVSDFRKFLLHPDNRDKLSFALRESGYAPDRVGFPAHAGWKHRRDAEEIRQHYQAIERQIEVEKARNSELRRQMGQAVPDEPAAPGLSRGKVNDAVAQAAGLVTGTGESASQTGGLPQLNLNQTAEELAAAQAGGASTNTVPDPTAATISLTPSISAVASRPEDAKGNVFDPAKEQHDGIVLGIGIGTTRFRDMNGQITDYYYVQPGDDVTVTFPTAGAPPRAVNEKFTVVDMYESKMSEYDATFAFVPLDKLQKYRGMIDPATGVGAVSSIQLRLRKGTKLEEVRDRLRAEFPMELGVQINTWRDLQGPLLAAVQMETTILNILLFLIIAVAGFGILATFFMIVVEKTKDIGILKSLGAHGSGVASIFLGYGVLLGAVGAGAGGVLGLLFVAYINNIADLLEIITGQEVFDPTIYYFDSIPTAVHPLMVVWVIIGAVMIAVMASVLPAMRAARMHPVEALRYE